jgi:DNA-binding NarL/FixJ family response regulator
MVADMTILDALLLVIIDEPGRERDALRTMLASVQNIRIVEMLDSCSDLSQWMNNRYPDVVIIRERSVNEECKGLLMSLKTANPQTRFLVIAEKSEQVQALLAEGIDYVFLRGFTSTELFTLLDQWSMDKIMHYFSNEQKQSPLNKRSSYLEILI